MDKFSKRFVSTALIATTGVWMSGAMLFVPAVAHGQTVEQLTQQINDLLALIEGLRLQLVNLGGTPGTGGAFAACTFTKDLTLGSKGADVKCLQQGLNASGYPVAATGAGSPGNETEYFGALTKAALGKWQAANNVSPPAGYFGPITRNKIASLGGGVTPPPPGTIPPPATGLLLSMAVDSPLARTVPKGATGVPLLKFNVSGSGTLDGLTFKRMGIGATGDFTSGGFYIYEGATRLTTGKSLNSTTHEVTFVNLALPVSGTRTFTLVGDINAGATANNQHNFTLISSTGDPTPSGSLSGSIATVGGQAVGGITLDKTGSLPAPKIGEQKAWLTEFKLTVDSTEDMEITRIALSEGGSINNSYLTNFVLEQNDQVVATGATIGAKDLATLTFATPFKIEKGQNKIFKLYGDIGGNSRSDDTIIFYVENAADISSRGLTYGFSASTTISAMDTTGEAHTLTLEGGQITITFNGPITGDIPLRGQDVTLFDFTIAAKNNIEIRNLRLNATTVEGAAAGGDFNDFKVWDVASNAVISSATDVTTTTAVTVTDIINLSAGQTKRMKVTADVDADDASGDTITVSLQDWLSNDVRNLDNNTYVATSTIVPAGSIAGNTQTVKTPSLDIQRAATPGSQSVVKGATGLALVGFSFRAVSDDIKITTIRVNASTTGLTSSISTVISDFTNLALYDGATRVSDFKGLSGSALPGTATFSSLNFKIPKGQTKVLTLKGNLSNDATVDGAYFFYHTSSSADITALDSDGNTATITGNDPNYQGADGSVVPGAKVTTLNAGDITVTKATDDGESKIGLVVAGTESILAKFKFTSQNEAMTINKLQLAVGSTTDDVAGIGLTESYDEVPMVKLYDGSTLIGDPAGYFVGTQGSNAGLVEITNLGWLIGKNQEKVLVVKGVLNAIDITSVNDADSGVGLAVHVSSSDFEATGATAKDTALANASGNLKLVYRNYPVIERVDLGNSVLSANSEVARFRVRNNGTSPLSFKAFQLKVEPTNATISAPAGTNNSNDWNVEVYDLASPSTKLNLASVTAGSSTTALSEGAASTTVGGTTGYMNVTLTTEEEIAAGGYSDYKVVVAVTDFTEATAVTSYIQTLLNGPESSATSSATYAAISQSDSWGGTTGLIWSDYSKISHTESTADWNWGYLVDLPATVWSSSQ